jgi:hypothetical protein
MSVRSSEDTAWRGDHVAISVMPATASHCCIGGSQVISVAPFISGAWAPQPTRFGLRVGGPTHAFRISRGRPNPRFSDFAWAPLDHSCLHAA